MAREKNHQLAEQYEHGIADLREAGRALRAAGTTNAEKQAQIKAIKDEITHLAFRLVDLVGPDAEQAASKELQRAHALLSKATGTFAVVAAVTGSQPHIELAKSADKLSADAKGRVDDETKVDSALQACAASRLEAITDEPARYGGLNWAIDRIEQDNRGVAELTARTDDLVQTALDDAF